ncbi:hypothetical protein [Macrococcoides caseolyticum]|uniref:hypothetical protein n=1 Tax=Macrococcoides caseolyticum TaxID=69966 RepID=UPI000C3392FE|nr:hypothetical protein [Macrococcus caseolyticus]PKE64234.1 hypothetical protein CW683_01275 [Macrococcus caseolyticus]
MNMKKWNDLTKDELFDEMKEFLEVFIQDREEELEYYSKQPNVEGELHAYESTLEYLNEFKEI